MPIAVKCPSCTATLHVDERFAGKTGTCPKCKTKMVVPHLATPAIAPPPLVVADPPAPSTPVRSHQPHVKGPFISSSLRMLLFVIGWLALPSGLGVAYWKFNEFEEVKRSIASSNELLESLKDMPMFEGARVSYSKDKDPLYRQKIRTWIIGGIAMAVCGGVCLLVAHLARPKKQQRSFHSTSHDAPDFLKQLGQ